MCIRDRAKLNAERSAARKKILEQLKTKGAQKIRSSESAAGGGAMKGWSRGRNPVFALKVNGKLVGEFQHQLRNSVDWELLFDSSSVQQPADQPFVLSPTSWNPKYELYLWIQKIKK